MNADDDLQRLTFREKKTQTPDARGVRCLLIYGDAGSLQPLLQAVLVSLDHLLDHLAADGAGLAAGQITVVALVQVDADLGSGLHLELIHSGTRLGNIDTIAVLAGHIHFLLFC